MSEQELRNAISNHSENVRRWLGVVIASKEDKEWKLRLDAEKEIIQHMAAELGIELEYGEPPNYPAIINHVMRKHGL